jgi:hypothetical protein
VTRLAGVAGGVQANIDRWCRQMGAPPLTPQEFEALPIIGVLGVDAPVVEVDGGYTGMNGESVPDARLIGFPLCLDRNPYVGRIVARFLREGRAEENEKRCSNCKPQFIQYIHYQSPMPDASRNAEFSRIAEVRQTLSRLNRHAHIGIYWRLPGTQEPHNVA